MDIESMRGGYLPWDVVSLALGRMACAVKCWWNDYDRSSYEEVNGTCQCNCYEPKTKVHMYFEPCPQSLHELEPKS